MYQLGKYLEGINLSLYTGVSLCISLSFFIWVFICILSTKYKNLDQSWFHVFLKTMYYSIKLDVSIKSPARIFVVYFAYRICMWKLLSIWKYNRRHASDYFDLMEAFSGIPMSRQTGFKGTLWNFYLIPSLLIRCLTWNTDGTGTQVHPRCICTPKQVEYFRRLPLANEHKEVTPAAQYSLRNQRTPVIHIA